MSASGRTRALTAPSASPPLNFVIRRMSNGRPATATEPPTSYFWRMPRRRPAIALRAGCIRPAPGKAIRLQHSHSVVRKRRRCRSMKDQYGVAEIESVLPCQDCGRHAVFMAAVASGKRPKLPYLRCCQCGRVRRDLRDAALLIDVNRISHLATAGQSGARANLAGASLRDGRLHSKADCKDCGVSQSASRKGRTNDFGARRLCVFSM
jgi:hypothetical protein